MGKRQAAEEQCVQDAEHRRARADGEGKRGDGEDRTQRAAPVYAERVFQIAADLAGEFRRNRGAQVRERAEPQTEARDEARGVTILVAKLAFHLSLIFFAISRGVEFEQPAIEFHASSGRSTLVSAKRTRSRRRTPSACTRRRPSGVMR